MADDTASGAGLQVKCRQTHFIHRMEGTVTASKDEKNFFEK